MKRVETSQTRESEAVRKDLVRKLEEDAVRELIVEREGAVEFAEGYAEQVAIEEDAAIALAAAREEEAEDVVRELVTARKEVLTSAGFSMEELYYCSQEFHSVDGGQSYADGNGPKDHYEVDPLVMFHGLSGTASHYYDFLG